MVVDEWQKTFPQLTQYSQFQFLKVIGVVIIGIELVKLPRTEQYRPHFVIYPLWKSDIKSCLDTPIILKEFYNKRGLQYSLPYDTNYIHFEEVLETIKKESPLDFDENIT